MWKSRIALIRVIGIAGFFLLAAAMLADGALAQDGKETDPAAALQAMLTAACRQDEAGFRNYLTKANGAAFWDDSALVSDRTLFADQGHLNVAGVKVFDEVFFRRLADRHRV